MTRLAPTARPPAILARHAEAARIHRDRVARLAEIVLARHGADPYRALRGAQALSDAEWFDVGNAARTLATPLVRAGVLEELAGKRRGLLR